LLPSSLLLTRRWRNKIRPVYAQLNQENLEVARLLIQTYRNYVGKKKGELNEVAAGLEDISYDYRYVRGLTTLLDRRCKLKTKATIYPIKARRQVFKISHRKAFPTTPEARQAVLNQAAAELEVPVEELEESLYADLEHELTLEGFEPLDPEALVKQYNLSLTQTLLFYSTELTFTTIGSWQRIFRQIKWLGLIYTISKSNGGYEIRVDGPASLFKLNRRYGTSLAKLLPTIVQNPEWHVKAKILRHRADRRLLDLELNSEKHGKIMKTLGAPEKAEKYDSQVEKSFAERFKAINTGWTLTREPEPIPVGRRVMIPDFGFWKSGITVYLEVAGFWTPQYIEEKIKKLQQLNDIDMIVAVNRDLACQKLDKIGERLNVIYYKRKIPLRPILAHLRAREERLVMEQTKRLRAEPLPIQKTIVDTKELAKKLEVLEEAVKAVFMEREFPGYTRLGDMLIKKTKLKEIQEQLETRLNSGELDFVEASKIIEDAGGRRADTLLDTLGYNIEWHGIDPHSTTIRRKEKS
jgi:predicted nuclease of restriction endonuclease-like RecB superfamily